MPEIDNEVPVVVEPEAYRESDSHLPDPTAHYGTMDTSGTAGIAESALDSASPVFAAAKAQDLAYAAKAVDPDDDTPLDSVILPDGQRSHKQAVEAVRAAAKAAAPEGKVEVGGETSAQTAAKDEGGTAGEKAVASSTAGTAGGSDFSSGSENTAADKGDKTDLKKA